MLVEVHDEEELERALEASTPTSSASTTATSPTSRVDVERTYELLTDVPAGKTVVSESGFHTREQLDELERVGVDAVLVGEALMRAPDPEAACRALTRRRRRARARFRNSTSGSCAIQRRPHHCRP